MYGNQYSGTPYSGTDACEINVTKTVSSKSRIQTSGLIKTLSTKGRIQKEFSQSIITKGRITTIIIQNIQVKSAIKKLFTKTITSKGRIQISFIKNISSKGRIQISFIKNISSKSKIICLSKPILVTPTNLSAEISPIYLVWEISSCCKNRNIHAHIQVDKTDDTFNDLEKDLYSFRDSDFEYWDGSEWKTYPVSGVISAYYGNQARVQVTLTIGNKWWRAKGGVK